MECIPKTINYKLTPYLVLLVLELLLDVSDCLTQAEINQHLELGNQYLRKGQLSDALNHYHSAVEGDPNNFLTYFRRGTVYFALGKAKNALNDFDRALEIKPDFTAARVNRGSIYFRLAEFDMAQLDFYNALQIDPHNVEAQTLIHRIEPAKEHKRSAQYFYSHNDYQSALTYLNEAIATSPWASELYDFRAEIHTELGDHLSAVTDYREATKLQSDNTDGYFKLSQLYYKIGHATDALRAIRDCLKLDPEHKKCFPFYKKVKKIEKLLSGAEQALEEKNYLDGIEDALKVLKNEQEVGSIVYEAKRILCACYANSEQSQEAIEVCSEALKLHEDQNVLCDRAEAYLQSDMYDDAIYDYKAALQLDGSFDRAKEGLNKAEARLKQAEKRDYYKILDVKRTATKKEIVKAYRKMAQKWHPDNYSMDEKMKKIAENKFIDIAAAKEVLTDEEKRKQFDMGEDPLDPESGKSNMPNFHHFQSFHGSPFQFKFHFN